MEELKEGLPDFSDLPDSDWYVTINDLLSDGMIDARVVRSGIYDAVGAAYNIEITRRGRALTPESPVEVPRVVDHLLQRHVPAQHSTTRHLLAAEETESAVRVTAQSSPPLPLSHSIWSASISRVPTAGVL